MMSTSLWLIFYGGSLCIDPFEAPPQSAAVNGGLVGDVAPLSAHQGGPWNTSGYTLLR